MKVAASARRLARHLLHPPPPPGNGGPNRLRLLALVAVTGGLAMGEVAAMKAVGYVSAFGLAPQVTAPPPFGVFHDMRWLAVYNSSWATFAGEVIGLIIARAVLNAVIIALAWPEASARPSWRGLLSANLGFTAIAVILLSPWACVSFAVSGTSLSWFVIGEMLEFVVLALVMQRGGIVPRWWFGLPSLRVAGLTVLIWFLLTAGALIINLTPGWWVLPVAGVAGAANAWTWRELIRAVLVDPARRRRPTLSQRPAWLRIPALPAVVSRAARRVPVLAVPVALLITGGSLVAMGQILGGGTSGTGMSSPWRAPAQGGPKLAVLYVDGYDSSYNGANPVVTSPGMTYKVYSYRGLNSHGLPRPYTELATHESLARSASLLATQVSALHRRTGRPVGIVAVSEGTFVTRTYLLSYAHPSVDAVVLFSPLIRPSRVYYPRAQAGSGFGYVTGLELGGILDLLRHTSGPPISVREPFVRSLVSRAPLYRNHMMCPAHGVRSIAFLSLASAATDPPGPLADIPVVEMPGVHASLEGWAQARREAITFLGGGHVQPRTMLSFELLRYSAAAWMTPALPLAVNPVWHYPTGAPDASFGGPICATRR